MSDVLRMKLRVAGLKPGRRILLLELDDAPESLLGGALKLGDVLEADLLVTVPVPELGQDEGGES